MRPSRCWFTALVLGSLLGAACDTDSVQPTPARDAAAPTAPQPDVITTLPEPAALGPVLRSHGHSETADAFFFTYDRTTGAFTYGFVSVFAVDPTPGSADVGLYYSIDRCDYSSCVELESGFGSIPAGDVSISQKSAILDTNTSYASNPDFFRFAGDGGPIHLEWTALSNFSSRMVSSENSTYGSIRYHRSYNGTYSGARAEGTVIGYDVDDDGSLGTSTDTEIAVSIANVVAAASGSGQITVNGEVRTFSFNALQTADGRVGGEWERYNRAYDARAHGKVSCMTIRGDIAWIGGFTTMATQVPGGVFWRAQDNGSPGAAADGISLQPVGQTDDVVQDYCYGTPDGPPLLPVESGNITIRP